MLPIWLLIILDLIAAIVFGVIVFVVLVRLGVVVTG